MKQFGDLLKNEKFKKYSFIVITIILLIIFCISITPVTLQNDTYYTIRIGEFISDTGTIDMQDHFSWHNGLAYTYPHWLYDLLTFFIFNSFGFYGIYITTCILSCILGLSLYLTSSKISKSYVVSFFTTVAALFLIKDYIAARAQLVTFIFFIFEIFCIEKFIESKKIRYGFFLLLMSLLIANLHCAVWPFFFVLFLPYIGEYLIAIVADIVIYRKLRLTFLKFKIKLLNKIIKNKEKIEKSENKLKDLESKNDQIKIKRDKAKENPYKIRIEKHPAVKWLVLILLVCILMGFITPIGTTPFTYLVKTLQGNTTKNINEHLPMTLANQTNTLIAIIIFLALLIFTNVKIKLSDLFMLSGLTYLMLMTKRQESMFGLICSVILAKLFVEIITNTFKGGLSNFNNFFTDFKTIILLTVLMCCFSYYLIKDKLDDEIVDDNAYPVAASDFILENIDLGKAKFYNEYNYGSYLLFRGIPVFIDSRADLYAPEFSGLKDDIFMDFMDTSSIGKFYNDIFDKYGITHVIVYKNAKVNMIIEKADSENYKKLYSDSSFVIYERLNVKK